MTKSTSVQGAMLEAFVEGSDTSAWQEYIRAEALRKGRMDQTDFRKLYLQEWEPENRRGGGRTTKAMTVARPDTFYVVARNREIPYAERLAQYLGRTDLNILSLAGFTSNPSMYAMIASRRAPVVFDHHVYTDDLDFMMLEQAEKMAGQLNRVAND